MDDDWLDRDKLHFAAMDGDVSQIAVLIGAGYPVNQFDDLGKTALHYAAEREHYAAVVYLLEVGADVNAHDERVIGNTPLADVAGQCSLRMARLLVQAGADPTIPGWMQLTAIHRAEGRKRGDGPLVYELLVQAAKNVGNR